jgi:hypothetical protein
VQGEHIIDMLSQHGVQFARYKEGDTNVAARCPFHNGQSYNFYVYIGPPSGKSIPGASFCHKCAEGWSLPTVLRQVGAPEAQIAYVKQYWKEAVTDAYKAYANKGITFTNKPIPEAALGIWSYWPRALLEGGFSKQLLEKHDIGFDRLNLRITFPIRDHLGTLVGVSGRATRIWQTERYKFYESELATLNGADYDFRRYRFDKGHVVYGLDKLWHGRTSGHPDVPPSIVVCEGFKAKLYVEKCGFPHSVAVMGPFISDEQIFLLGAVTSNVTLFLDHDEAGRRATPKQVRRLRKQGIITRIADYGTDEPISPDDLQPNQVRHAINNPINLRAWEKKYGIEPSQSTWRI